MTDEQALKILMRPSPEERALTMLLGATDRALGVCPRHKVTLVDGVCVQCERMVDHG